MEPVLSMADVEAALKSKTAPRVTEESIKDKIKSVEYIYHDTLTICIIEMINGWKSTGVSAPASAANYDIEIGKRYAFDNAFKPLWQLEGYLLRQTLYIKAQTEEVAL